MGVLADPAFKIMDAVFLLKQIKPKICFIVPESIELIKKSLQEAEVDADIVVYDDLASYNLDDIEEEYIIPFSKFLQKHEDEAEFIPEKADSNETCCMYFSSGSTGLPKAVELSHKSVFHVGHIMKANCLINIKPAVLLCYSGFYWISALFFFSLSIVSGSARIVCQSFNTAKFWEILDNYKVTFAFIAPVQAHEIIAFNRPENIDTTSLTTLITGGSHFATDSNHKLRDLLPGTFVVNGYGSTEATIISAFNLKSIKDRLCLHSKPESSGKPVAGNQYKVVNPETELPCDVNERGELRIKSEYLFNGYFELDSSYCFDKDGFFKTGDMVYFDEDYCFYIVDRIKELLKYRNWQISPALIEQALQTHPAVARAVVIGIPDEIDGDHPMALVVPTDSDDATEESLLQYVNDRVNDVHQLRGGLKFVKGIPVTPSGKVQRRKLREMVLNNETI